MPWRVGKSSKCGPSKPWGIFKEGSSDPEYCHTSRADAMKQVAALYASTKDEHKEKTPSLYNEDGTVNIDELSKEVAKGVNEKGYYGGYVSGATSFQQLQDYRDSQQTMYDVSCLTDDFSILASNILLSPEVSDKSAALSMLAKEYTTKVGQAIGGGQQDSNPMDGLRAAPPDVEAVAKKLIQEDFPYLAHMNVLLAVRDTALKGEDGQTTVAACGVSSDPSDPFDCVWWFAYDLWQMMTDQEREAIVFHEFMHCNHDQMMHGVLRPHDASVFNAEVERYGVWWKRPAAEYGGYEEVPVGSTALPDTQASGVNWNSVNWNSEAWQHIIQMAVNWNSVNWNSVNWNSELFKKAVQAYVNWNSVNWNSVNWNSVNWNSEDFRKLVMGHVNWNSVNWNSVNWNSEAFQNMITAYVNWNSVNWNSVNWNSVNWNSVNWNSVNWNSVNWNSVNWNSKEMDAMKAAKTENGTKHSASEYAYVGDPKEPSTWKLRLTDASGKITVAQLGRAAAAFSSGGFRGQKVSLPAKAVASAKAKIRAAYKKLGVKDADIPDSVKERFNWRRIINSFTGEEVYKEVAGIKFGIDDFAIVPDPRKPDTWQVQVSSEPGKSDLVQLSRAFTELEQNRKEYGEYADFAMDAIMAEVDFILASDENAGDLAVWKEVSGQWRWAAVYSNNMQDEDNPPETITEQSHLAFTQLVKEAELPYPELWHWHLPGTRWGVADFLDYRDGFALAGGTIDPGHEKEAEILAGQRNIKVSHGMPKATLVYDPDDGSKIIFHMTKEISDLPDYAAANQATSFRVDLTKEADVNLAEVIKEKSEYLKGLGYSDAQISEVTARIGSYKKEKTDEQHDKEDGQEAATPAAEAEAAPQKTEAELQMEQIATMRSQLDALQTEMVASVKEVKDIVTDLRVLRDLQLSEVKEGTPRESKSFIDRMMQAGSPMAQGGASARIDGRSALAKSSPKEKNEDTQGVTGIPILDQAFAGMAKSSQQQ